MLRSYIMPADDTTNDVEREFAELEAQLAVCGPGILDVIEAVEA